MTYPTNLAPRCFGRALSEPVRCRPSLHLPSTYPSLHTIQPHTRARQVTAHGTRSVIRLHNPSTSTSSTRGFTSPQSSLTRLLRQSLAEKPTCPYSTQKEDETKQDFRGGKKRLLSKRILGSLPIHENIYTIPNILTFSRLVAAPIIGYLTVNDQHVAALALFIYAGATDLVDGWIARKWNLQTVVGTVIDPMADKTLMTVLTVSLAVKGALPTILQLLVGHRGYHEHPSASDVQDVSQLLAAAGRSADENRTTTTVADAVTTLPQTLTVAQVTEIVTTTITAGGILKRDGAAAVTSAVDVVPQPYSYDYVSSLASEADQNATRSIQGSNVMTEYAATVTAGTSTITVTSNALPVFTYPYLNTSEPSADSTSFTTVSTTSTRYNTTYITGTALPFPLNTTSLLPPYPTSNTSSAAALTTTGPSLDPTSSSSASSSNTSTAILSIGTSINMSSSSAPTSVASTAPPGIGTSVNPRGCNTINNTIFTDDTGRQYQIQCYLRYGGPVSIGLDSATFRECMDECSTVNAGFSAIRCYGVTWLKYARGTVRCNLKAQAPLLEGGIYDGEAASAVLLTGVPPPVAGQFRVGDGDDDDDWGSGPAGSLADHNPGTWREGRIA
ncbi:MAG: hypothetical protein LQ348_002813 [Seirophora lacunosa]|nr:MAG: hypothetical protein LQ348_002813 [Seirophora lacunosa]